ncbi:MAG: galactose oxidase, partial [Bacteroidetes bacterium]|nr:galactose oxidase [Fibrella sp.]
ASSTTVWEYEPTADTWTERGTFEGPNRLYSIGFSLGTKGYVTTGGSASSSFDDLWEFDPTAAQDLEN